MNLSNFTYFMFKNLRKITFFGNTGKYGKLDTLHNSLVKEPNFDFKLHKMYLYV